MDTTKAKKNSKKQETEREYIEVRSMEVKNVRVVDGKNGDLIFLTLVLNGVQINNCRIATGKNGDFVSFPQYKGKDGNYYSYVYAALSEEDTLAICEAVQKEIDG